MAVRARDRAPERVAPRYRPYLSGLHAGWLLDGGGPSTREIDGTLVFADISGFTPLTEKLARRGKIGAEELTETLNTVFRELLDVGSRFGGDCLKFGGDALLLLFTGDDHAARGAAAARGMLAALEALRRRRVPGVAKLDMSLGVHTGPVHVYLVGSSHRELIVAGPTVSGVLALESIAEPGQILMSDEVCERDADGPAVPWPLPSTVDGGDCADGVPERLRPHLDGTPHDGEHRLACVCFLKFGHVDQMIVDHGPKAVGYELGRLVDRVQAACAAHEVTFLGTDVDRDGGKIMLATGAPTATHDDEDRMLLTLRDILDDPGALPLRAGVNRGRIFALDLGSPARRTFTVMGDAVNLAARVMAHASWGELLATNDVLARTRTDFDLDVEPPFMVKGKSEPIAAQRVGPARGRRDEQTPETTLVGRSAEVALMRDAVARAHHGEGQIIELVGVPGIGKSALVTTITQLEHGLTRFTFEAGRYSLATPYFALRRGLRTAMGLALDAPAHDVESALRAIVDQAAPDLEPWLPLLGIPLGLELEDTAETARLDPANRQAILHNAVVRLMTHVLSQPALIVIEDSHWLDAASCELLRALLAGVERRPWAVLVTRRDVPGGLALDASDAVTTLRLEPLSRAALVELASDAANGTILPPGVVDALIERSGGNPLFLQELVNASVTGVGADLPDTIEAVVATTIDTLAPHDRTLLRHAAVLGNHFPAAVLGPMLDANEQRVRTDIDRLRHFLVHDARGMVRFRHVLLRDVAYEGLPFRTRRALHHRAGTILEQSTDHPESLAELLSIHFHRAGRYRESWRYSRLAGERAQRNGAAVEAAAFYNDALEAARHVRDVEPAARAEVAEWLGDVWDLGGRYDRADNAYREARRMSRIDVLRRGRLCRKIGLLRDKEGRYPDAQRWFTRGLRELAAAPDQRAATQVRAGLLSASGSSKLRQGRHLSALPVLEEAIRLAEESDDRAALAHALYQLDRAYSEMGEYAEACFSERAVALYEQLGDEHGLAGAYNQLGIAAYWRGDWDRAVALYTRAREAEERAGALVDIAIFVNNIGEIRSDQGRLDEAEQLLEQAHELWAGGGWVIGAAWAMSNLGRVAARRGRLDDAADRFRATRSSLAEIGAEAMVLENEVRDVERLVFAGDHERAIAVARDLRGRATKLGLANVTNMLDRLEGCALSQRGDIGAGLSLLERAVIDSRERGAEYESALSLDALVQVGRRIGRRGSDDLAVESEAIFARLGVVAPPTVPTTTAQTVQ